MSDEIFEFTLEIESIEEFEVGVSPIVQGSLPIETNFTVEEEI